MVESSVFGLRSSVLSSFFGAAMALFGAANDAVCQTEAGGNELVIHLYVDPIYGEDGLVNQEYNPDGAGLECSGATIVGPHSVVDSNGASLLHAPYPFKTVTAAIARINQLSAGPGVPPLPHTDASTSKVWSYCIIHLLPGWYGRAGGPGSIRNDSLLGPTLTHRANRLVPNGETFPLHVPPRVSLVGTSALNTVFDLGQVGTAIEFGVVDSNSVAIDGEATTIDKIAFFACGGRQPAQGSPVIENDARKCAAILIDDQIASRPTISNCMFQKNAIGVLVNGRAEIWRGQPVPHAIHHDGTTLINCTFAWNMIGLWSGQIDAPVSIGASKLNLINNIFDGSETLDVTARLQCDHIAATSVHGAWPSWTIGGSSHQVSGIHSAFEGISLSDLRVLVAGMPTDFNAYEAAPAAGSTTVLRNYNTLSALPVGAIASSLPATFPRVAGTFDPDPLRNIAGLTGWPNQNAPGTAATVRGVLYVADLICRGSYAQAFPQPLAAPALGGFDLSMHDLRLSPFAVAAGLQLGVGLEPTPLPNPMVDSGFAGPFPCSMANGNVLATPPGYLVLGATSQPNWEHHAWQSDAEGYGNPRIHDHPAYAGSPGTEGEPIDVGADELGELVVAGFRFGTTSFLRFPEAHPDNPSGSPVVDNSQLFYLGPPSAASFALPPIVVPQPDYRSLDGFLISLLGYAYPAGYSPTSPIAGRTWHSAEFADPLGTGSQARPHYGHREQAFPFPRVMPPPVIPAPVPHSPTNDWVADFLLAFIEVGNGYRATPADATPVLLPDIHPWWVDLPPLVLLQAQAFAMSPTLAVWQDSGNCPTGNYFYNNVYVVSGGSTLHFGLHNGFLYADPSAFDLPAPGSGAGGVFSGGAGYAWLDSYPSPDGVPTAAIGFEHWATSPLVLSNYDGFGRGGSGANRQIGLPATTVADPLNLNPPEGALMAFSIEWSDGNVPWSMPTGLARQTNVQSFKVMVNSDAN